MENSNARKILKRLQRLGEAKDKHKNHHMKECAFKAQPKASTNMAKQVPTWQLLHWKMLRLWKTKMHLCFSRFLNKKWCQILKLEST